MVRHLLMKRYVSVLGMIRRGGFTLVEVMVSVMIVSVVIASIYTLRGDVGTKLFELDKLMQKSSYATFVIGEANNSKLFDDFKLEDNLRQKLKAQQFKVSYEKTSIIDTSKYDANASLVLEIGTTTLQSLHGTNHLLRVQIP